jgi:hypothetical protein
MLERGRGFTRSRAGGGDCCISASRVKERRSFTAPDWLAGGLASSLDYCADTEDGASQNMD